MDGARTSLCVSLYLLCLFSVTASDAGFMELLLWSPAMPVIVLPSFHRKTTTTASGAGASRLEVTHDVYHPVQQHSCLVYSPVNMGSNRISISVKLGPDALPEELRAAVHFSDFLSTNSHLASALDTGIKRSVAYGCALRITVG